MKKQILSNGKIGKGHLSNQGDWAPIKFNRVFRLQSIRSLLSLTEPVYYLKETITRCDAFICGEYMVTVICDKPGKKRLEVPLRLLSFNKRQEEELVELGIVPKDYFSSFHEVTYIKSEDDCNSE